MALIRLRTVRESLVLILWTRICGICYNPLKSNQFSDSLSVRADIRESMNYMDWERPLHLNAGQNQVDALIPQESRNQGNYHIAQEGFQNDSASRIQN